MRGILQGTGSGFVGPPKFRECLVAGVKLPNVDSPEAPRAPMTGSIYFLRILITDLSGQLTPLSDAAFDVVLPNGETRLCAQPIHAYICQGSTNCLDP